MRFHQSMKFTLLASVLLLAACGDPYDPTLRPDYTVRVAPASPGSKQMVAIPPECPSWAAYTRDPYDNQITPQFGCANARNLALSVEHPADLVAPQPLGPTSGVVALGAMRRYDASQTRGLIDSSSAPDTAVASTTSSAPASTLSGDMPASPAGAGGSAGAASP